METILSWIFLFIGISNGTAEWFIASGVFAIAAYLNEMRKER